MKIRGVFVCDKVENFSVSNKAPVQHLIAGF